MATNLPSVATVKSASAVESDIKNYLQGINDFLTAILGSTGLQQDALTALAAPLNKKTEKSSAYTVISTDRGKVIDCTGAFTLSITVAATLGDGFVFAVQNSRAGVIKIYPSSAETIDSAPTKAVGAGKLVLVYCDGTKYTSIGTADLSSASIISALGYTPANQPNAGTYVTKDFGVGVSRWGMAHINYWLHNICCEWSRCDWIFFVDRKSRNMEKYR